MARDIIEWCAMVGVVALGTGLLLLAASSGVVLG